MIEHLKIPSHPAVWTIFATDIIGWNCHFHLMLASTSSAVFNWCPSYSQSYCSSISNGSTSLRAIYHHTPAPSLGFFLIFAAGQYWGELRVCVWGSPNVTFLTYLLLRAFLWTYIVSSQQTTAVTTRNPATSVRWSTYHTAGPTAKHMATNAYSAMHSCKYENKSLQ